MGKKEHFPPTNPIVIGLNVNKSTMEGDTHFF